MSRLFAIADLHLSLIGSKPMDRFGEIWVDHAQTMARRWDALVSAEDWLLLPGDLSWARNEKEVQPDLEWIEARPGKKLLLRGNHDSWWGSRAKLEALLPPSCTALMHDAAQIGDLVVVGARGWTAPDDPIAGPSDGKLFQREISRLKLSIEDADRRFDRTNRRIAMTHFPPLLLGRSPSDVVPLLQAANVRLCAYGHLHGDDHRLAVDGEVEGVDYKFVAADAIEMRPRLIMESVYE